MKQFWKWIVIPIIVVVIILMSLDVILALIEVVSNYGTNDLTYHWVLDLASNCLIAVALAFGSRSISALIKRRSALMADVYGQDTGGLGEFMTMRLKQLKEFGFFYLILDMTILLGAILLMIIFP